MKNLFLILLVVGACREVQQQSNDTIESAPWIGTWQLLSAQTIVGEDTTFTDYTLGMKGIKMLNATSFAFFQHDLSKGTDSLVRYMSGGGTYHYEQGHYTEYLEYCTARQWEGHTFEFDLQVEGDTLTQIGVEKIEALGVDRWIREIYVKINE